MILLAISRANGCDYCVAVHSTVADMARVPTEITEAVRNGDPVPDPRLDALVTFTTAFVDTRGRPTAAQVDAFLAGGFTETDILQVLLAVAVKTISNYTNHLFDTPLDDRIARRAWAGRAAEPDPEGGDGADRR